MTIAVHNEGEPISPELRARLFKPLSRGSATFDRATRNVGLGLYIVDQIESAHGGRVDVQSSAETGTTFTIHLPQTAPSR